MPRTPAYPVATEGDEGAPGRSLGLDDSSRDLARLRAEKDVRAERDLSNALLDSLPGVFYFYDRYGNFLRWNENLQKLTGYSPEELTKMHPLDLIAESDRPLVATRIAEVFANGHASVEAGLRARDGTVIPYHFTGVRTERDNRECLVGVGIDLTKRKRAEDAQRASEQRYRTLFEYAPDGILIADAQSHYLDANPAMCRMLGYSLDQLIGLHGRDIVVPDEASLIDSALDEIKSKSDHVRQWRFRRQDGSVFPAEVIATLMPDGNIMAVVRDISERKAAERLQRNLQETLERKVEERTAELQAALVRAEAADRLKSAFLATMSHELRTPLNSILGFTGILLKEFAGPLTQEQTKQLAMVQASGRHLLNLINDVLDISKIEAGQLAIQPERFDVSTTIERVLGVARPLAEGKGLALSATMASELGEVHTDRRRLEQILLNLLNNAIKFTDRGSVTLATDLVDDFRPEGIRAVMPGIRFRVTDTGIGIKPEDLGTLFRPFRQIDTGLARQHEGTGLGLAICRRLATLMGGTVSVSSAWSKGSTFTLTLPINGGHQR